MRRIAYDCEFIEGFWHGHPTIDLVSIGLVDVDEARRDLYLISHEFDTAEFWRRPWLAQNVGPYLPWQLTVDESAEPDRSSDHVRSRAQIAQAVTEFILGDEPGGGVQLWADYGAYDHVVLHWLWGGMAGRPERMPMFSHDLRQAMAHRGLTDADLPARGDADAHHALADAHYLATCIRHLDALTGRQ